MSHCTGRVLIIAVNVRPIGKYLAKTNTLAYFVTAAGMNKRIYNIGTVRKKF